MIYRIIKKNGKFFAQSRSQWWPFWSNIARLSHMFAEVCWCDTENEAQGLIERDRQSREPAVVVRDPA